MQAAQDVARTAAGKIGDAKDRYTICSQLGCSGNLHNGRGARNGRKNKEVRKSRK